MIISHLMGGLGNQMFEYAAGLSLARRRRTVLKLDTTFYREHDVDDRHYSLDCLNVPAQFATREEIASLNVGLTRQEKIAQSLFANLGLPKFAALLEKRGQAHYQTQWTYYPEFHELPDNTWLHGNYQSEKFFAPVADLLRHQFTFRYPATPAVEAMAARIKSGPSVAVHFRRGDYVEQYATIGAMSRAYYDSAVAYLQPLLPRDTVFYLFSDDIEQVRREYQPQYSHVFVDCIGPSNDYDSMRLMALCDHNIIANSTFSWWAAWLNRNPDKLVVAPRNWFAANSNPVEDMIPSSWQKI